MACALCSFGACLTDRSTMGETLTLQLIDISSRSGDATGRIYFTAYGNQIQ